MNKELFVSLLKELMDEGRLSVSLQTERNYHSHGTDLKVVLVLDDVTVSDTVYLPR